MINKAPWFCFYREVRLEARAGPCAGGFDLFL